MNKEEFRAKKEIINSKINELKNEMIKLEKEYIESNVKHPIGSKVCITTLIEKQGKSRELLLYTRLLLV